MRELSRCDNFGGEEGPRDWNLDTLLALDGEALVLGNGPPYWVKFVARPVPASPGRPHGPHFSLTLHGGRGERLLGFDNAHPVRRGSGPGARKRPEHNYRHRLQSVRSYDYRDAGTLLADFWAEVEAFLRERGVTP